MEATTRIPEKSLTISGAGAIERLHKWEPYWKVREVNHKIFPQPTVIGKDEIVKIALDARKTSRASLRKNIRR